MTDKARTILNLLGSQTTPLKLVTDNQDTSDIIHAILDKHDSCQGDYDKFSFLFDTGTVPNICGDLFDFCKQNIAYVVEKTKAQYASSPGTILKRGTGDCKSYALFCGGVLDALRRQGKRINWCFRFASYNLFKKDPYHVFIVVRYQGQDIFLDPVFPSFNYKRPAMWVQDYKVSTVPAAIAGMYADNQGRLNVLSDCVCAEDDANDRAMSTMGATTADSGTSIIKVSAALAPIPVVGWIAAAAGGIIGGALAIFGDKHQQSSDVLWLVQLYQQNVLGQTGITASNANDALTQQAQAWFSAVVGVPIGARSDFNILQTGDTNSNHPSSKSDQERGNDYIIWKNLQGKVSPEMAAAAAHIAATLNPYQATPKSWASRTAAPWTIQANPAATATTAPGASTSFASLFSNKWMLLLLVGAGLGFILYKPKPVHHVKRS
jgi:hypothetical protein